MITNMRRKIFFLNLCSIIERLKYEDFVINLLHHFGITTAKSNDSNFKVTMFWFHNINLTVPSYTLTLGFKVCGVPKLFYYFIFKVKVRSFRMGKLNSLNQI